jgi:pimeloyl-ACP methyl ester carboxylesterase
MTNVSHVDYIDEGQGEVVILVHSSVSGNRQWHALIDALRDRYRVLAVNLFGYGRTPPWPSHEAQTLADQARLVLAAGHPLPAPVHIVGHSFGGSVALKAASLLGPGLGTLLLFEPNPFYLLKQHGRAEAYEEARALRDHVKRFGSRGDWRSVAARFADYWVGDGAWAAMPDKRRAAFAEALPPNFHEWDAVMTEQTPVHEWAALSGRTLLVTSAHPRRPIREIAELFRKACPHWSFTQLAEGGHMAPLTHPETINSITRRFLDDGTVAA